MSILDLRSKNIHSKWTASKEYLSITVTVKGADKCELSEKFAECAFEESPKVSTIT